MQEKKVLHLSGHALEWGSDRVDLPIRGLCSLVFGEDEGRVVAAETAGPGKAGDHSTAVLRGRLNLFLLLSPICLR